jgi:hypothetical protein
LAHGSTGADSAHELSILPDPSRLVRALLPVGNRAVRRHPREAEYRGERIDSIKSSVRPEVWVGDDARPDPEQGLDERSDGRAVPRLQRRRRLVHARQPIPASAPPGATKVSVAAGSPVFHALHRDRPAKLSRTRPEIPGTPPRLLCPSRSSFEATPSRSQPKSHLGTRSLSRIGTIHELPPVLPATARHGPSADAPRARCGHPGGTPAFIARVEVGPRVLPVAPVVASSIRSPTTGSGPLKQRAWIHLNRHGGLGPLGARRPS